MIKFLFGGLIIIIIATIFFSIIFLYSALAWGFVLFNFWQWFIIPVFPMLPTITIIQAMGLYFFTSFFKNHNLPIIKEEYLNNTMKNWMLFLAPWITFILGYLLSLLM